MAKNADFSTIVQLSSEFSQAVLGMLKSDPALLRQVEDSITPEDRKAFETKAAEIAPHALFALFGVDAPDSTKLNSIHTIELAMKIYQRVVPEETIRGFVKKEMKTEAVAKTFEKIGAPVLASYCR